MNSGTDSPATNSARSIRISIVEGATSDRDPALVAAVDEVQRTLLREVGVGDDHLLDPLGVAITSVSWSSEPSERSPFSGRGVSEM